MIDAKRIQLPVNNAPDVHFTGVLLHEYSTQNREKTKPRWSELRLWETLGGAWIAEKVGFSDKPGEGDLRDVLVIANPDKSVDLSPELLRSLGIDPPLDAPAARVGRSVSLNDIEMVMDFFGWSSVAKAFAKAAGWDAVRHVD